MSEGGGGGKRLFRYTESSYKCSDRSDVSSLPFLWHMTDQRKQTKKLTDRPSNLRTREFLWSLRVQNDLERLLTLVKMPLISLSNSNWIENFNYRKFHIEIHIHTFYIIDIEIISLL